MAPTRLSVRTFAKNQKGLGLTSNQRSLLPAPLAFRRTSPGTRPAALGEPAPTREVPDCPPPSRRASQGPGLARTSPVWLPATERRFVHSALNPCCCYVVATPDIYPTTITSSQGLNQPTASWSPSTATPGTRPAALGEPAPTREVPDCPPPSRRASQGPGLARTSPVWLPATERRFVHSALNPCCCYVVATPDIYPTTITSSQGLNQPTASWSPSTAT
ncbi:hypothetical protein MRX96_036394 [Rhipicephalus microplus]